MGLKMPGDEEVLTNKIFLRRAGNRSKAKSWLNASIGAEIEQTAASQLSRTSHEAVGSDINTIDASDELSGIGLAPKVEDDPLNRQLMSANEALRKKLLSKEAYKRYSEGRNPNVAVTQSRSKKREHVEESDEEEEKGKSIQQVALIPPQEGNGQADNSAGASLAPSKVSSKGKKRPNSYLDQLLADRKGKQQKKAKKNDSDD